MIAGEKMLSVHIDFKQLIIKDIKKRDLPYMIKWYNDKKEYQYATGLNTPIFLQQLTQRYMALIHTESAFYVGIYLKGTGEMIGLFKGSVRKEKVVALWIDSIIIDKQYRRQGYATLSLQAMITHFKEYAYISKVYISVVEHNLAGIKFWHANDFEVAQKMSKQLMLDQKKYDILVMCKVL